MAAFSSANNPASSSHHAIDTFDEMHGGMLMETSLIRTRMRARELLLLVDIL
jgi:hypothetical protein